MTTATKERLNVNVDSTLKAQTAATLAEIGLDFTTAINVYFRKIVSTRRIPFELSASPLYSVDEVAGPGWRDGLDLVADEWE